jgi:hypothetical protein
MPCLRRTCGLAWNTISVDRCRGCKAMLLGGAEADVRLAAARTKGKAQTSNRSMDHWRLAGGLLARWFDAFSRFVSRFGSGIAAIFAGPRERKKTRSERMLLADLDDHQEIKGAFHDCVELIHPATEVGALPEQQRRARSHFNASFEAPGLNRSVAQRANRRRPAHRPLL